jgi:hypothetical protein
VSQREPRSCDGAITLEVLRRINWTMVSAIPWYGSRGIKYAPGDSPLIFHVRAGMSSWQTWRTSSGSEGAPVRRDNQQPYDATICAMQFSSCGIMYERQRTGPRIPGTRNRNAAGQNLADQNWSDQIFPDQHSGSIRSVRSASIRANPWPALIRRSLSRIPPGCATQSPTVPLRSRASDPPSMPFRRYRDESTASLPQIL